jgi:preprotein translocase subunit SecA
MDRMGANEGEVITHGMVTKSIERAQKRVEMQNFEARKRLLDYDDVMNQQREVVYSLRLFALEKGEELKGEARRMVDAALDRSARTFIGAASPEEYDRGGLKEALTMQYLVTPESVADAQATPDLDAMALAAQHEGQASFDRKLEYLQAFGKQIGVPDVDEQVLSQVMLAVLDEKWKDHLYDLDQLRNAIHYRGWGQKDPLVEYKKEAYEMFEDLMRDIQATFTERFLKVTVTADAPPPPPPPVLPPPPQPAATGGSDDLFMGMPPRAPEPAPAAPAARGGPAPAVSTSVGRLGAAAATVPEVGRNDPCPCGSGKKYKKCHGQGMSPPRAGHHPAPRRSLDGQARERRYRHATSNRSSTTPSSIAVTTAGFEGAVTVQLGATSRSSNDCGTGAARKSTLPEVVSTPCSHA